MRVSPAVTMSGVDLKKESFGRLADLVCAGYFLGLELTPELPEEEPTILQQLLSDDVAPGTASARPGNALRVSAGLPARRRAAVGRNAPCPCGSGKK